LRSFRIAVAVARYGAHVTATGRPAPQTQLLAAAGVPVAFWECPWNVDRTTMSFNAKPVTDVPEGACDRRHVPEAAGVGPAGAEAKANKGAWRRGFPSELESVSGKTLATTDRFAASRSSRDWPAPAAGGPAKPSGSPSVMQRCRRRSTQRDVRRERAWG